MKRALLILLLGLIGVLLQGTLLRIVLPAALIPNFILILVVYVACYQGNPLGAVLSFLLGLEYDLFCSENLLGPYAASSVLVFCLISSFSTRLFLESFFTIFIAVAVSTVTNYLVYVVVVSQFRPVESLIWEMFKFGFLETLVSALIAPALFSVLRNRLDRPRVRASSGQLGWSA